MPIFCTEMKVWDNVYNQFVKLDGPRIDAPNWELAEQQIKSRELRWLKITGELISEIPCKKDSFEPDWNNQIDYQKIQQN